jgi:hypothetical protein
LASGEIADGTTVQTRSLDEGGQPQRVASARGKPTRSADEGEVRPMARRTERSRDRDSNVQQDRRLPAEAGWVARWLRAFRGLLSRPVGVQRVNGRFRAGFLERRRAPSDALEVRAIVGDLHERLIAQDPLLAATVFAPLVQIHDALRLKGWPGVLALPASVRSRALFQAQMLTQKGPTPAMNQFVRRLLATQNATAPDPSPAVVDRTAAGSVADSEPEVSETSTEEFEASQRGWLDTVSTLPDEGRPTAKAEA